MHLFELESSFVRHNNASQKEYSLWITKANKKVQAILTR